LEDNVINGKPTNGRRKGRKGEQLVAKLCREYGFEARRGQQYAGGADSPDVVHNIEGYHLEVKFYGDCPFGTKKLDEWLEQAERDCPDGHIGAVVFKWNRSDWWIVRLTRNDEYLIERFTQFLERKARQRKVKQDVQQGIQPGHPPDHLV
jgi:hypothetical protein